VEGQGPPLTFTSNQKLKIMNKITLKQTVTYKVTFYDDDFENEEQFNLFVERLKTEDSLLVNTFVENVNRDNLNSASDIEIEIS
jgi:hypothetical protein